MLRLIMPGNYRYIFNQQQDGTYTDSIDPAYSGDVFSQNQDSTYTLKRKNGWSYTFDTYKLLDSITDPNGNTLALNRLFDTNVSQIVTPEGNQITINYVGSTRDYITSITGPAGTVTYTYYSTGR